MRLFATLLLALPCLLLAGCGEERDPGPPPPDVVVIVLDTLRADALSVYGNPREDAPYLSSLAQRGTVFQRAWSTSTWTAPSTASLMTGVYPDRHGVTRGFMAQFREGDTVAAEELEDLELLTIASEAPTLAEHFRGLGYKTYGLASNVNIGPEMGFERGFQFFERHDMQPARLLRERLQAWKADMEADDDPVFLYLHFNDVHKPYDLRPRFYQPEEGRDETAELRARYQSELGYLDSFLARIHEDLGLGDDTLLVVTADHGEEFREHGRLYHDFSLHVELAWIPLLIHAPALRVAPGVAPGNVSLIDIAPTVFELLGLDPPKGVSSDGISLAELCWSTQKAQAGLLSELKTRPLMQHRFERGKHLWGVIQDNWKLIRAEVGYKLYDLAQDPSEQNDLTGERGDRVQELNELIEKHKARDPRPNSLRTQVDIDEDLLERLKAAGYVGGGEDDDG